jgi:hypothetical protein
LQYLSWKPWQNLFLKRGKVYILICIISYPGTGGKARNNWGFLMEKYIFSGFYRAGVGYLWILLGIS